MGGTRAGDSVTLRAQIDPDLRALSGRARGARGDLEKALALAADLGGELPVPARGDTLRLWESLATLGAADLTVARVVEPHLDALAILDEAGRRAQPVGAVWGVFAAEGGERLRAASTDDGAVDAHGHQAVVLPRRPSHPRAGHGLGRRVPAWALRGGPRSSRRESPAGNALGGARPRPGAQHRPRVRRRAGPPARCRRGGTSSGRASPGVASAWPRSGTAQPWPWLDGCARPRPTASLTRSRWPTSVPSTSRSPGHEPSSSTRHRSWTAPGSRPRTPPGSPCGSVRSVADTVDEVLLRSGHALGPGPLATEGEHAGRVSDLALYVRQHHAERDAAALGRSVLSDKGDGAWAWW